MSQVIPFKLLEIVIVSAQDLPPVSKMLRTFVVAWIDPDNKLSTRIDHHGHTNPTWNYKLVFKVEDRFLRSESASINIEIYNVAWLRDLPIGTTRLLINHLSPPLVLNNPTMRSVSLHICRPNTGHLQGILNVGINILDNFNPGMPPPVGSELSASLTDYDALRNQNDNNEEKDDSKKEEGKMEEWMDLKIEKLSNISSIMSPFDEENIKVPSEKSTLSDKLSKLEVQSKGTTANLSMISVMKPIPSEVAVNFKKGLYSNAGEEYGSSIFENWSEGGDGSSGLKPKTDTSWKEDQVPEIKDLHYLKQHHTKKTRQKRRSHSDGGGLFSCIGKGFEFTFMCGSNSMKENRKKKHHHHHCNHSDETMNRFFN